MNNTLYSFIKDSKNFTRLTVLKDVLNPSDKTHKYVEARCTCGTIKVYRKDRVDSLKTRSCGCLKKFLERKRVDSLLTFFSEDKKVRKAYHAWVHMKQRVLNKQNVDYHDYGGRGIDIRDEWVDDFTAFYIYIGDAPTDAHSIGRINNSGDYDLFNVAWQTPAEQSRNTRRNVLITLDGLTLCQKDWLDKFNLTYCIYMNRIDKGWTPEQALRTPKGRHYPAHFNN